VSSHGNVVERENFSVPLKDMMFGATIGDGEQPKGLECSSSGTRKWIKELSSLANVVVGHCAR